MQKTFIVTITLTYDNVKDEEKLKQQVFSEAQSWVDSGSFGDDGYCDEGELTNNNVTIEAKPEEPPKKCCLGASIPSYGHSRNCLGSEGYYDEKLNTVVRRTNG